MERLPSLRRILINGPVLVGLCALIFLPRPVAGWWDLGVGLRAMQAGAYAKAAAAYASAARRLPWQPSIWEQAGLAALAGGDAQTAILDFNQIAEKDLLSSTGWIALGDASLKADGLPAAVYAWERALPAAEAYDRLAQARREMGEFQKAAQEWRALLALRPEDANAHYQLGLLLAATAPREALSELVRAASLDAQLDASVQDLRTSLNTALLSEDPAYQFVISGRTLAAQGEWDLAAEAFRRAAVLRPDYGDAWAWLGEARQHLGADGLSDLQRAVALDPGSAMIQMLYGIYWQRQGQARRALEAFQVAAGLQPEEAGFQIALGSAYEQSGDLVAALEHYRRAVELAPQDAAPWRALAELSLTYDADIPGTGFPAAQRLLALAPDDWQSHDIAGRATLELGNLLDAEGQFLKAIELAPGQAAPYLHLGLVYMQSGNRSGAYEALLKARSLDPDGPFGRQADRLLEQYFP